MRHLPPVVLAAFFLTLVPACAWAQKLHCNPCSHGFGDVAIGSSVSFSIQLTNTGKSLLRITSKSEKGLGFTFGSFPIPTKLQPGATIALPVIFTPKSKGYFDATLTLTSNDPKSPLTMHVGGTGFYESNAQLNVTPLTLPFGKVTVGSSATLQGILKATNSAVTVSSAQSNSSEFAILGLTLPVTIQANHSVSFTVQFTPNASGGASGKLGFVSNALNSPAIEQVTGTGVAAGPHSVDLSWVPGDGTAVGYNVYRGTASGGPFQEINPVLDASTNYLDLTVTAGATYYYVATEVNAEGQESAYSNVIQAVIPTP